MITQSTQPADLGIADPSYMGMARRNADCVFIQVTMSEGRSVEKKRAFFKKRSPMACTSGSACAAKTSSSNWSRSAKENWSFGNGVAQYA